VSRDVLEVKLGRLPPAIMEKVDRALEISLGLRRPRGLRPRGE
jgi:mRNA-degrading endonuclease toxin of MazEF toxin-antitoxin module